MCLFLAYFITCWLKYDLFYFSSVTLRMEVLKGMPYWHLVSNILHSRACTPTYALVSKHPWHQLDTLVERGDEWHGGRPHYTSESPTPLWIVRVLFQFFNLRWVSYSAFRKYSHPLTFSKCCCVPAWFLKWLKLDFFCHYTQYPIMSKWI
jgi:hypothetical protein